MVDTILVCILTLLCALSLSSSAHASPFLPHRLVYQFPKVIFVENVAARADGNLILTTFEPAAIYIFDVDVPIPILYLLFIFPNATIARGIAEFALDLFAINVRNIINPSF
jgi:hypothetical protein